MRFRYRLLLRFSILSLSMTAACAVAQSDFDEHGPAFRFHDGGAGGMMQSIFIPPKPNAPFSMVLHTEWSKPLATSGTITVTNERRIARDSTGRIFQERRYLVPKGSPLESEVRVYQISDPNLHAWYDCDPRTKICDEHSYRLGAGRSYAPALAPAGPLPNGHGVRRSDDLGEGTSEGVATHGYRETTIYNPGAMGNDREMISTREFWYSPELAVDLISIVDEPMSGRQVFTAGGVARSEPEPSLFAVPEGYRVVDHRAKETSAHEIGKSE